jgi:hypothetical protein
MKMYTVRRTGEYLIQVDAASKEDAIAEAEATDMEDWDLIDWYESRAEEG